MNRAARLATALATAALLLTACNPYPPGPAGQVIAKNTRYNPSTKTNRHYLTVRTPKGDEVKFKVPSDHYHRCYRGSSYPACTKRTDRD